MKTSTILVALFLLCGCSPPERSVEYYAEHTAERTEQLGICKSEGTKVEASVNCKHALEADTKAPSKKL